ncbi:MAG: hypothetical protein ACRC7R_05400, partial [Sarcina sp.]
GEEVKDLTAKAENGKVTITSTEKAEEGLYTVTLTNKYNDENGEEKTVTNSITVELVKAGDLDSYSVEIGTTTLDLNKNNKDAKQETTLTVYALDENKNTIEKANTTIEVKDKDGNEVKDGLTYKEGKLTAVKEGTYTVKVKVGSFVAKQLTIKVENTASKATTINLTQSMTTVKEGTKVVDAIKALKPEVIDQFGAVMEKAQITDATYTVASPENVNLETDMFDKDQEIKLVDGKETGSFELSIKKLTVDGNKTNVAKKIVIINVVADAAKRAEAAGAKETAELEKAKDAAAKEATEAKDAEDAAKKALETAENEKKTADENVTKAEKAKEAADKGSNAAD